MTYPSDESEIARLVSGLDKAHRQTSPAETNPVRSGQLDAEEMRTIDRVLGRPSSPSDYEPKTETGRKVAALTREVEELHQRADAMAEDAVYEPAEIDRLVSTYVRRPNDENPGSSRDDDVSEVARLTAMRKDLSDA